MRAPKLFLLVGALAAAACGLPASPVEPPPSTTSVAPASGSVTDDLPGSRTASVEDAAPDALPWGIERIALERELAASDARFAPRMDESGPVLETPGSVVATFGASGAALSFGAGATTMRVAAIGRDGAMRPASVSDAAEIIGAEVRTARGAGVSEWWRSLPSGLEHGVTITDRPAGDGELVVEVEVTGALSAHVISDDAVELVDREGARVATYAHLVVLDADSTSVPARMSLDGERIALAIDDAGARYPLVIDPLVTAEEAALLAPDGAGSDLFGTSVALSADGSRALVGAPNDVTAGGLRAGSARVLLRTGTTWAEEATLLVSDGAAGDQLGYSVALSSDGSRALIGAYGDDTARGVDAGSARVFVRAGTSWAPEATLVAPDGAPNDFFGYSVALSSDGSRALVGAHQDTTAGGTNAGSARVFLRTGTTWSQEATLLAPDGAQDDYFGYSVAFSSDASRALIGVLYDDTSGVPAGGARVFLRTGTSWTQEAALFAPDGANSDNFGRSVALSSDGSRALVGAREDDTARGMDAGSARVFVRTGTGWADEAMLVASDAAPGDNLGMAVALSADGSRALVGAFQDGTVAGALVGSARVFLRTGSAWAEQSTLLAADGAAMDRFGSSVALSADGSRALVGAPYDDISGRLYAGSAHVFTIHATDGTTCSGDAECLSGFCTDGVCCGTPCAGGPNDCEACSAALTGGTDGVCGLLSAAVAPTVTCRVASDLCDAPESCIATSSACPPDALAAATTVCRAAATACDIAEVCSGASAACPTDGVAPATTVCRPAATACDAPDTCTGTSTECAPDMPAAAATVCRPAAGPCDGVELCDGATFACPGDAVLSGVECRASSGVCDIVEVCSGTSASCPPDGLLSTGVSCRASTNPACDPGESCDGVTSSCPADVTTCGPMIDGGAVDGAVPLDAPGSGGDAGTPPAAATGCSCRAATRHAPFGTLIGFLLSLALHRRARRRA